MNDLHTNIILDIAKIVISMIMLAASALCLYIIFCQRSIYAALMKMEVHAQERRDDLMFELTALRARLGKMSGRADEMQPIDRSHLNQQLLKFAGSAVMLVLQKEKGWLKWGMLAAKVGKDVFDYFRQARKD